MLCLTVCASETEHSIRCPEANILAKRTYSRPHFFNFTIERWFFKNAGWPFEYTFEVAFCLSVYAWQQANLKSAWRKILYFDRSMQKIKVHAFSKHDPLLILKKRDSLSYAYFWHTSPAIAITIKPRRCTTKLEFVSTWQNSTKTFFERDIYCNAFSGACPPSSQLHGAKFWAKDSGFWSIVPGIFHVLTMFLTPCGYHLE
jgi:hypothetical protein